MIFVTLVERVTENGEKPLRTRHCNRLFQFFGSLAGFGGEGSKSIAFVGSQETTRSPEVRRSRAKDVLHDDGGMPLRYGCPSRVSLSHTICPTSLLHFPWSATRFHCTRQEVSMIILDRPYVSEELKQYLSITKTPILKNDTALRCRKNSALNIVSEEHFLQWYAQGRRLYTCSENSIDWIVKNIVMKNCSIALKG